ncbi:MAG: D-alanyl-D-alanine carboxypeptidase family protein [Actinomycetota bacterium]
MSLILVCTSTVLALLLGGFVREISQVSYQKARAQLAADAAALAAVAEAGPFGEGLPAYQARRFAQANGARLLECRCDPSATAAQVEVAVGDVIARARAVIDPEKLLPAPVSWSHDGLDPRLAAAVEALVDASGGRISIGSGYRTYQEQAVLWAEALARYGDPEIADDWVARPGHSMHERGLAVDLRGDLALAERLVVDLGLPLHSPLPNEPWHFELTY